MDIHGLIRKGYSLLLSILNKKKVITLLLSSSFSIALPGNLITLSPSPVFDPWDPLQKKLNPHPLLLPILLLHSLSTFLLAFPIRLLLFCTTFRFSHFPLFPSFFQIFPFPQLLYTFPLFPPTSFLLSLFSLNSFSLSSFPFFPSLFLPMPPSILPLILLPLSLPHPLRPPSTSNQIQPEPRPPHYRPQEKIIQLSDLPHNLLLRRRLIPLAGRLHTLKQHNSSMYFLSWWAVYSKA